MRRVGSESRGARNRGLLALDLTRLYILDIGFLLLTILTIRGLGCLRAQRVFKRRYISINDTILGLSRNFAKRLSRSGHGRRGRKCRTGRRRDRLVICRRRDRRGTCSCGKIFGGICGSIDGRR